VNSTTSMSRLTSRTAAVAACLAALLAGASACGTEDGTSPNTVAASPGVKAGRTSADLLGAAKARHDAYLRQLAAQRAEHQRAERAEALRGGHGHLAHHTRR
jgi:hypothetical protein